MKINWQTRPAYEWHQLLRLVPRSNYLQSLPHARAAGTSDRKRTRFGLLELDNNPVGLVAIQEIKLGPIHVVDLYRGPLWFVEHPPIGWLEQFAETFANTFPKRILRRRRWLPEWEDGPEVHEILRTNGYRTEGSSYQTVCLDLTKSLAVLRDELKPKWRNALVKAERQNLKFNRDEIGKTAALFLAQYESDRSVKGYKGRSVDFLKEEIRSSMTLKEGLILWAYLGVAPIAGIYVLVHGTTATYRVGWTTPAGRRTNAHNALLWEAIKWLQQKSVGQFDLGGVEPQSAAGLTSFKKGLGGEALQLPGIFN